MLHPQPIKLSNSDKIKSYEMLKTIQYTFL